jgi:hypothetical protein
MSEHAKRLWRENREKMVAASSKGWSQQRREQQSMRAKSLWDDPTSKFNSPEHRQRISDCVTKHAATRTAVRAFSRCKNGFRADLAKTFRSSWEANYARYLNFLQSRGEIIGWKYEPKTFWFEAIRRGCRSYKPDFEVEVSPGVIEYHEVKGWLYPRSKTALARMRKYFPGVTVVLIDQKRYMALSRTIGRILPNWEYPSKAQ